MAGRHRRAAPARQEPADASRNRMLAITGVVAGVIALAVILPLVLSSGGENRTASGPTATPTSTIATTVAPPISGSPTPEPSTSSPTPAATTSSSPKPTRTSTKPNRPLDPPTLVVRADRGNSWLLVLNARGQRVFNGLLRDGAKRTFDGPYFRVVIGNAAAVDVVVNGDHRPRGARGAVIRFTARG